jgi:hypothetical protein
MFPQVLFKMFGRKEKLGMNKYNSFFSATSGTQTITVFRKRFGRTTSFAATRATASKQRGTAANIIRQL